MYGLEGLQPIVIWPMFRILPHYSAGTCYAIPACAAVLRSVYPFAKGDIRLLEYAKGNIWDRRRSQCFDDKVR